MDEYSIKQLFDFKNGVPSVYGAMLGDTEGVGAEVENMIREHEPDDMNFRFFLEDYHVSAEFFYSWEGDCIEEMHVRMPVECMEESDIKMIYYAICAMMDYTDRKAQYNYGSDDELEDVDIFIKDDFFVVTITMPRCFHKTLDIAISGTKSECRLYQTIAYMARESDMVLQGYIRNMFDNPKVNGSVLQHEDKA